MVAYRVSDASTGHSDAQGHTVGINRTTGDELRMTRYITGSFNELFSGANPLVDGVPVTAVLGGVDAASLHSVRVWDYEAGTEPATAQASVTNSSLDVAGYAGIFCQTTTVDIDILYLSVGTDGDLAPRPSAGPQTVLSTPTGSVDTSGNFSGGVDTTDPAGTLSYVVTRSTTAPTPAQVIAGNNESGAAAFASGSQAVSATGTQSVSGTGIDDSITHYIYFVQDGGVEQSAVSGSAGFDSVPSAVKPVLSLVSASAAPSGDHSGAVSTDVAVGTLTYVVTTSGIAPLGTEVEAGLDHTGSAAVEVASVVVTATGEQLVSGTGLTYGVAYYLHFVHVNDTEYSDVISSAEIVARSAAPTDLAATEITATTALLSWVRGV
jgi:hypothetical protein